MLDGSKVQRLERKLVDRTALLQLVQRQAQRVTDVDLVAAKCADDQEMPEVAGRTEPTDHVQRGHVPELQIVKEDHQGLLVSNHSDEVEKRDLKSILGLRPRQLWHWRLRADDQFEIRNEVNQQLSVRCEATQ